MDRRAVTLFQPSEKIIKRPKKLTICYHFFMDAPDNPTDPKEVELREGNKKTPAPNREIFTII